MFYYDAKHMILASGNVTKFVLTSGQKQNKICNLFWHKIYS